MVTDIILAVGVIWAVFQLTILVIRLFGGKDRLDWYVLNSICLFLIGFVFYFGFGIALDDGAVESSKIPAFEIRFAIAVFILLSGLIYPILWPIRVLLRLLGMSEKR